MKAKKMAPNPKREGTEHAIAHTWTLACYAPPKCRRDNRPMQSALNLKQKEALRRYADAGVVKYPHELGIRASTATALERRGFIKHFFHAYEMTGAHCHDWSKYIITDAGRAALATSAPLVSGKGHPE